MSRIQTSFEFLTVYKPHHMEMWQRFHQHISLFSTAGFSMSAKSTITHKTHKFCSTSRVQKSFYVNNSDTHPWASFVNQGCHSHCSAFDGANLITGTDGLICAAGAQRETGCIVMDCIRRTVTLLATVFPSQCMYIFIFYIILYLYFIFGHQLMACKLSKF